MNRKRLAGVLGALVATTGIAVAQPPIGYDRGIDEAPRRGQLYSDWVTLAEAYTAYGARQALPVDAPAGRFRVLRIQATRGRPFIHRVVLVYGDGSRRNFWVQRPLGYRQGFALDIDGREVRQVLVIAEPDPQASYAIFAR